MHATRTRSIVEVLTIGSDAEGIWVVYRNVYVPGILGYRQVVDSQELECELAADIATQVWYAELEPFPDLMQAEHIAGVQWWGDEPFPDLAM